MAILLILDALIYLPFIKAYDATLILQEQGQGAVAVAGATDGPAVAEATTATEATATTTADTVDKADEQPLKKLDQQLKVLVLCAGGGTSEQLANALVEGAKATGEPIVATAGAYGSHHDILPNYDLVVLAPQVRTYYSDLKADTDKLGIKLVATKGQQYIALTHDPANAVKFVLDAVNNT